MSEGNHTLLFAQISGFRVMVLANRLGCDNDLARRAHDALLKELDTVAGFLRAATSAGLALARNSDPAEVEDLMEWRYSVLDDLVDYVQDGPHPLLDFVEIDHATREWYDGDAGRWRFLADSEPVMNDVSNRALCGLRDIMDQIERETRLEFDAYLSETSSAQVDEQAFDENLPIRTADEDGWEVEDPVSNPLYGPDTD